MRNVIDPIVVTTSLRTLHSRRAARLLSRLKKRFDLTTELVPVGPLRILFTRVTDPKRVLNDLCDKIDAYERQTGQRVRGDELGLPYWAEIWDSSLGVGQWLIEHHRTQDLRLCRILDLGCGMGLAGTVAAILGAQVTFGDIERDALGFAALNGLRYSPHVKTRRMDWQTDDLRTTFDLILGADVLYEKSQWESLDRFVKNHLAPRGLVLFGEPGRITGQMWQQWIRDRGWELTQTYQHLPARASPIRLFILNRCLKKT